MEGSVGSRAVFVIAASARRSRTWTNDPVFSGFKFETMLSENCRMTETTVHNIPLLHSLQLSLSLSLFTIKVLICITFFVRDPVFDSQSKSRENQDPKLYLSVLESESEWQEAKNSVAGFHHLHVYINEEWIEKNELTPVGRTPRRRVRSTFYSQLWRTLPGFNYAEKVTADNRRRGAPSRGTRGSEGDERNNPINRVPYVRLCATGTRVIRANFLSLISWWVVGPVIWLDSPWRENMGGIERDGGHCGEHYSLGVPLADDRVRTAGQEALGCHSDH